MSANIRNIEAINDFRVALIIFMEGALSALQMMGMELNQSAEWIEHDRPHYWKNQERVAFDRVAQTRTAYETCRMRTVAGHRPSCIEERVAYEAAKRRAQHCHEQIAVIKRWARKLSQESDEFMGRLARLQTMLEVDLPKSVARLEKMSTHLEAYAEIDKPFHEDA